MSKIFCNFTKCVHNNTGICSCEHIFISVQPHHYPECFSAEIVGTSVESSMNLKLLEVVRDDDSDEVSAVVYDSEFYEIIEKKSPNLVRGFQLRFFPKLRINRYLVDIYDETGSYDYNYEGKTNWPQFSTKAHTSITDSPEATAELIKAYQIAMKIMKTAEEFWKEGGEYEAAHAR